MEWKFESSCDPAAGKITAEPNETLARKKNIQNKMEL